MSQTHAAVSPVMEELSRYVAAAAHTSLPVSVAQETKAHLLDTVAAIISGSRLEAGQRALAYILKKGGLSEASVLTTDMMIAAGDAAFANAMMAHADETDDSHKESRSHLGCGVVPAALAVAEAKGLDGSALLRAVALGYDIGARVLLAVGPLKFHQAGHCTHAFAGVFGAAAASAALMGLETRQCGWTLSYAAQQAAGLTSWRRSSDHTEKAFVFAGMPARNGVLAAEMVAEGFRGVNDVFTGAQNFFQTFGKDPQPGVLVQGLGRRFEIVNTTIKKWSVGSPVQSVLDGIEFLMKAHDFRASEVERVELRMAPIEIDTVNGREMPNINLQHLVAVALLDRGLTFLSSHDAERMLDPGVRAVRERVTIIPDESRERRKALTTVILADGCSLSHQAGAVRGTPENPMDEEEVTDKALDLMSPILGDGRARALVEAVWRLDKNARVRDLRRFFVKP